VETIEQSAEPLLPDQPDKLACAVFLAHSISDYQDQGLETEQILTSLSTQVIEQLGLTEQVVKDKLPEVLNAKSELDGLLD
jgi:activator of 2-hydroxyglutaryl-CoA dehydratase